MTSGTREQKAKVSNTRVQKAKLSNFKTLTVNKFPFLMLQPENSAEILKWGRSSHISVKILEKEKTKTQPLKARVISDPYVMQKELSRFFTSLPEDSKTDLKLTLNFHSGNEQLHLTTELLRNKVLPLLEAISAIERLLNPGAESVPRIVSLTQNSPIEFSMKGASDAYKAIRDDIIPWRREHQKELAALAEAEAAAKIARKKAEIAEVEARSTKEKAEAERTLAEAARIDAEVESLNFQLKAEKIKLALTIIDKLRPNATETERYELFASLLPQINNLSLPQPEISLPPDNK